MSVENLDVTERKVIIENGRCWRHLQKLEIELLPNMELGMKILTFHSQPAERVVIYVLLREEEIKLFL